MMVLIIKVGKTARIATDYGPMPLEQALEIVAELTRDAIESGSDDRWIVDPE